MDFNLNGKNFYINSLLATNLISLCYNVKNDWDFVVLITGDRTVRTGKSVLAQTVAAFLVYCLNKMKINAEWNINNIYFSSNKFISDALKYPQYSVLVYDEGREAFASSKMFTDVQKDIMDYFAECGQLNHIFVIVLPDFFNLVEDMAVARSELLLNVYRREVKIQKDVFHDGIMRPIVKFERGHFEFFNRIYKRRLYDKAKAIRIKSYSVVKANFLGDFINQYTVDEESYRQKKREWLARFKERKKEQEIRPRPTDLIRDTILLDLEKQGMKSVVMSKYLFDKYKYEITDYSIRRILHKLHKREDDLESAKLEEINELKHDPTAENPEEDAHKYPNSIKNSIVL